MIIQGLKFWQLKNYQLTEANPSSNGKCLTFDHNNRIVFACCNNSIVYIPVDSLLNFDVWSKSFLDTVDSQLNGKVVIEVGNDSIVCHSVSISNRGFGSKLAVCCYDSSQSLLFINIYDLETIYKQKEKVCLKHIVLF